MPHAHRVPHTDRCRLCCALFRGRYPSQIVLPMAPLSQQEATLHAAYRKLWHLAPYIEYIMAGSPKVCAREREREKQTKKERETAVATNECKLRIDWRIIDGK